MSKGILITFGIFIVIIIGLLAVIIFREPVPTDFSSREKEYKDSILVLQRGIDLSHARQLKLQESFDSLSALEPDIIYRTHDKIKFILTDASPDELDSIIRTNWKTKSRYR